MTLNPPMMGLPSPQILSSMTDDLCQAGLAAVSGGGSGTYPGANVALFVPVRLAQRRTYTKAWWWNGTGVSGNVDVGLFTISGATATRVAVSTAEAAAGVSVIQVATTFASTTVEAGLYYLAVSASSGTYTMWKTSLTSVTTRMLGCFRATTAHPLPASVTVAAYSDAQVPVFGLSELATV